MIKKNEQYTIKIDDTGKDGEGIGKIDGFTVFVEHTLPRDVADIIIVKVNKNYAFGKLINIIEPSPDRIEAKCIVAKRCGGCVFQHLDYSAELRQKQKTVKDALERIGGFERAEIDAKTQNIIGMTEPYYYRNKAQFPIQRNSKSGEIDIGFFSPRSHNIINIDSCAISHPINDKIISVFRDFAAQNNIEPYDEITHSGLVRNIFTRIGFYTGEIMVCIVINGQKLPKADKLIEKLTRIDGMTSIMLNINTSKTNVILGGAVINLWGKNYISDYIGGKKFNISALSFYQINPVQTQILYQKALEMSGVAHDNGNRDRDIICVDAYCGIGTISLCFADYVEKVYGIEVVQTAVADAIENAKLNNIGNAEFISGKAEDEISKMIRERKIIPDLIIADPPRKGCDIKLLEVISEAKIKKMIYVSCDPATLARDMKYLCGNGYTIERIQPVDMFPRTNHVETVVSLALDE